MPNTHEMDVIIIGGGWAGLSAAIKLVEAGKSVCIVEVAKQLGGRARKVQYKQYSVDNGTHIMIGAYTETLKLIKKVHAQSHSQVKESDILERQALSLNYKILSKGDISIPHFTLPAPFNIILSFLFTKGLTLKEKRLILLLGIKIKLGFFNKLSDIALKTFLQQEKQTPGIIKNIWEPLCLAIMNTPIAQASSNIFLTVIKEAFFKSRRASDFLFFKKDLSETFPIPAQRFIEQKNVRILFKQTITGLKPVANGYLASSLADSFLAKDIIIATAPIAAIKLLSNLKTSPSLHNLIQRLSQFSYQPICTIYIQYPESVQCERSMQGFLGSTSQWMFDKSTTNQAGFVSIIVSSEGEHMQWDNPTLIENISHELSQLYPNWPQPVDAFVIREKRATFTASVNINRIRPINKTDIKHIWLAGDYTNTQYPATLEGAVRSGLLCAEQILAE